MDSVAGKASTLPDETALLWQKWWHLTTDELVCRWFLAIRVDSEPLRQSNGQESVQMTITYFDSFDISHVLLVLPS